MKRRASFLSSLAGAGLILVSCGGGSSADLVFGNGAAGSAQVLPAGRAVELIDPGVAIFRPADGRLRGYGFSAVVTGVAQAQQAGDPNTSSAVRAARGRHLVVFSVDFTTYSTPDQAGDGTGPLFTADVSIGGAHVDVDTTDLSRYGRATFAVSVPNGTGDVNFEMTAAGLTQDFSLVSLRRVGPQPAVLYRDPAKYSLSVAVDQTENVAADVPADGFGAVETLGVKSLTLTDFQPGNPSVHPSDPSEAYLVVAATEASDPNPAPGDPPGSHFVSDFKAVPGSALTLTVPGEPPTTATHSGSSRYGLLDGSYFFTVPADLTSATLAIAPGTVVGAEYPVFTGDTATVDFPQAATFDLTLPAVPPPPKQTPSTVPVGAGSTTAPTAPVNHSRGRASYWELLAVAILVLVALATSLQWRRRRHRPVLSHRPTPYRPLRSIGGAPALLALPPGPAAIGPPASDPDPSDSVEGPGIEGTPVTTTVPTEVAEPSATALEVLVLGPVEVTGWRRRPRRQVVTPLLCYLCLHPGRPVTGDQLLAALWPISSDRREASRASLHTYVSELRRSLLAGMLPDAGTTDGYVLTGAVATDWATFTALVAEAEDADPPRAAELRARALSLVRGVPFAGATSPAFEWVTAEHHVAAMEVAITECAHQLMAWQLLTGNPTEAEDAARSGLLGVPDSAVLHGDLVRAARASGDPAGIRRAWKGARRVLGDDGVARLADELGEDGPRHRAT